MITYQGRHLLPIAAGCASLEEQLMNLTDITSAED